MKLNLTAAFEHLERMSDERGLFEHADGSVARLEHGYCTDDNARLLLVTSREPDVGAAARLSRLALDFVLDAQAPDGRVRNRMDSSGTWTDTHSTDDCWGRTMWALGSAAAGHADLAVRSRARAAFDVGAGQRSRWPRAMAFAALGAADVLTIDATHVAARNLLVHANRTIGTIPFGSWRWPEPRLTYANATLADAVLACGHALGSLALRERGLGMLSWLLALETTDGHLSPAGTAGRRRGDVGPMFDQQPIEAAAMADACWRAGAITGDVAWAHGVAVAARWFEGDNDARARMQDPRSGGGFDGLRADGPNLNQGAESTLALISTMQRAHAVAQVAR